MASPSRKKNAQNTGKKTSKKKSSTGKKKSAKKNIKAIRTGAFQTRQESHEEINTSRRQVAGENFLDEHSDYDDLDDYNTREKHMSIGDHLEELRIRLIAIIVVLLLFSVLAGIYSSRIHELVIAPYRALTNNRDLFLMNVYGPFESIVKLSLLTGFSVSFPVILYILWGFVSPAVTGLTAFLGRLVVAVSAILYWGGMIFTWFYILPLSLKFMIIDLALPGTVPQLTLERYYSFVFMLELSSGLVFQLPLVLVLLGAMGILTIEFHKFIWKYVLVGIFVFSALATPPDPLSQVLFSIPLIVLYITAVFIVWIIEFMQNRRRKKEEAELDAFERSLTR